MKLLSRRFVSLMLAMVMVASVPMTVSATEGSEELYEVTSEGETTGEEEVKKESATPSKSVDASTDKYDLVGGIVLDSYSLQMKVDSTKTLTASWVSPRLYRYRQWL